MSTLPPTPQIHLRIQGRLCGPFPQEQVKTMVKQGLVSPDDGISMDGGNKWARIGKTSLRKYIPDKLPDPGSQAGGSAAPSSGKSSVILLSVTPAAAAESTTATSKPAPAPVSAPAEPSPAPAPAATSKSVSPSKPEASKPKAATAVREALPAKPAAAANPSVEKASGQPSGRPSVPPTIQPSGKSSIGKGRQVRLEAPPADSRHDPLGDTLAFAALSAPPPAPPPVEAPPAPVETKTSPRQEKKAKKGGTLAGFRFKRSSATEAAAQELEDALLKQRVKKAKPERGAAEADSLPTPMADAVAAVKEELPQVKPPTMSWGRWACIVGVAFLIGVGAAVLMVRPHSGSDEEAKVPKAEPANLFKLGPMDPGRMVVIPGIVDGVEGRADPAQLPGLRARSALVRLCDGRASILCAVAIRVQGDSPKPNTVFAVIDDAGAVKPSDTALLCDNAGHLVDLGSRVRVTGKVRYQNIDIHRMKPILEVIAVKAVPSEPAE